MVYASGPWPSGVAVSGVNPYGFSSVGGQTYSYDGNGNILNTGTGTGSTAYTWDYQGKMMRVTPYGSSATTFTYDALGRMVETNLGGSINQFAYSPQGDALASMSGQVLQAGRVPLPQGGQALRDAKREGARLAASGTVAVSVTSIRGPAHAVHPPFQMVLTTPAGPGLNRQVPGPKLAVLRSGCSMTRHPLQVDVC